MLTAVLVVAAVLAVVLPLRLVRCEHGVCVETWDS